MDAGSTRSSRSSSCASFVSAKSHLTSDNADDDSTPSATSISDPDPDPVTHWSFHSHSMPVPALLWPTQIETIHPTPPYTDYLKHWDTITSPISKTIYLRILPALVRAGKLLELSEPFFARVVFAERKKGVDKNGEPWIYLDPSFKRLAPNQLYDFDQCVRRVTQSVRVIMCPEELPRSVYETRSSLHIRSREWWGLAFQVVFWRPELFIHLSHRFSSFFSHPKYDQIPEKTRDNVLFALVTTILHEMAHIFWTVRVQVELACEMRDPMETRDEPYWEVSDPRAEIGEAWERWFWGAKVRTLDSGRAKSFGCGRKEDDEVKAKGFPDEIFFRVVGSMMMTWDPMGGEAEDYPEKYVRADELVDKFWTDAGFAEIVAEFEARKKRWESQIQEMEG
jgi:hypothetical protein